MKKHPNIYIYTDVECSKENKSEMEYVNGIEEYILRNFFKLFTSFHSGSREGKKSWLRVGAMLKNIKTFQVVSIYLSMRLSVCLWDGFVGRLKCGASIGMYVFLYSLGVLWIVTTPSYRVWSDAWCLPFMSLNALRNQKKKKTTPRMGDPILYDTMSEGGCRLNHIPPSHHIWESAIRLCTVKTICVVFFSFASAWKTPAAVVQHNRRSAVIYWT